jgi:hypothetical protein
LRIPPSHLVCASSFSLASPHLTVVPYTEIRDPLVNLLKREIRKFLAAQARNARCYVRLDFFPARVWNEMKVCTRDLGSSFVSYVFQRGFSVSVRQRKGGKVFETVSPDVHSLSRMLGAEWWVRATEDHRNVQNAVESGACPGQAFCNTHWQGLEIRKVKLSFDTVDFALSFGFNLVLHTPLA